MLCSSWSYKALMDESALERLSIIKALKLMSDRFRFMYFSDNQIICASQWFQFHGLY